MIIKWKLVSVFLLLSLVPAIVLGVINYSQAEREITRETLTKLEALAIMQEKALEGATQSNYERVFSFTSRVQLKIELDSYNKNGSPESLAFVNNLLQTAKSQIPSIKEVFIMNPEGIAIASTDDHEVGHDHSQSEFFIKGRQETNIGLYIEDEDHDPATYLVGPMIQEGNLVGVVAITTDLEDLNSITATYASLSETGESYLAKKNEKGDIVILTPLRFDTDSVLTVADESDFSIMAQAVNGVEQTFTDSVDYRGKPVLAVTDYIEAADLGLVVKIDRDEAFAPLEELKFLTISASTIGAVVIIIAAMHLGRSISSPITKLRDDINEIAKGNFDVKIEIDNKDEIGELAAHFDKMKENIKSMNENLQNMVWEKTQQLQDANEELKSTNMSLNVLNGLLERQKEQVSEADKAKDEFSAMITHELKTPLVPIIGYCELMLDGSLGELTQKQREKIQIMHNSAASLQRLISDLLDARKLEMGQMKFNIVNGVSAEKIVVQCVNTVQPLTKAKNVILEYKVAEELKLNCDQKRIEQVLYNLLTNAIKFVPEKTGKIEVVVDKYHSDQILFSVKDNGTGIPKDKQARLFQKFYQADTSLSRNAGGTGLGLAISKGIVEAHKGYIWFETQVDVGTVFSFTVPQAATLEIKEEKS